MKSDRESAMALASLLRFVDRAPLTATIADIERALEGSTGADLPTLLREHGISPDLLVAARLLRERVGRLSDVIHATAIVLTLPHLLEPDERLRRPSLAAGNDPSRPYDVETNHRIAEFKLARWDGHDATRKRQLVKDLVHLAADDSGRSAELYVLGDRPIRFLRHTRAKVAWALDRAPATRTLFERRFGSMDVPIPVFVHGRGSAVSVIKLDERFPILFKEDA